MHAYAFKILYHATSGNAGKTNMDVNGINDLIQLYCFPCMLRQCKQLNSMWINQERSDTDD